MAKKQSLYASKDKVKHIKKEIKEGVPFDIPVAPSDMPKWFQKATKGILAKNKPKSKPKSSPKLKKKFATAGQDSTGYTTALATGAKSKPKAKPKDPYVPRDKDLYTPTPLTPSKQWSELVESKGKAAGFKGAKPPKKKKPLKN